MKPHKDKLGKTVLKLSGSAIFHKQKWNKNLLTIVIMGSKQSYK